MNNDKILEIEFVNRAGLKLKNFKKKKTDLWNCSCPFCGDSQKSNKKARGFFGYDDSGKFCFYCHNCLKAMSFAFYLKAQAPELYNDFIFAKFRKRNFEPKEEIDYVKPSFPVTQGHSYVLGQRISDLLDSHEGRRYLSTRKIPECYQETLFYAHSFAEVVENSWPEKADGLPRDSRIIIPFYDDKGNLIGLQGRALDKRTKLRYCTVKLTDQKMIYVPGGMDKIDWSKDIYVMEGPFDSMFIPNSMAVASSDIDSALLDSNTNAHFIYDNQPREKIIVRLLQRSIDRGNSVCIWPKSFVYKDINDAIIAGYSQQQILEVINNSLCRGLQAKLRFLSWKKF